MWVELLVSIIVDLNNVMQKKSQVLIIGPLFKFPNQFVDAIRLLLHNTYNSLKTVDIGIVEPFSGQRTFFNVSDAFSSSCAGHWLALI